MVKNQAYIFLIFIINGFFIGILFDIFRIWRRSFKTSNLMTYFQDVLFWILTGISLLYTIFTFSSGEIRFYMFLGAFLGALLYMLMISKYFIKINVKIIDFIKRIFKRIIFIFLYPIRFIIKLFKKLLKKLFKKLLFKPIRFIIINIRKRKNTLQKNIKFMSNSQK